MTNAKEVVMIKFLSKFKFLFRIRKRRSRVCESGFKDGAGPRPFKPDVGTPGPKNEWGAIARSGY
jgi:hypothetical protein